MSADEGPTLSGPRRSLSGVPRRDPWALGVAARDGIDEAETSDGMSRARGSADEGREEVYGVTARDVAGVANGLGGGAGRGYMTVFLDHGTA